MSKPLTEKSRQHFTKTHKTQKRDPIKTISEQLKNLAPEEICLIHTDPKIALEVSRTTDPFTNKEILDCKFPKVTNGKIIQGEYLSNAEILDLTGLDLSAISAAQDTEHDSPELYPDLFQDESEAKIAARITIQTSIRNLEEEFAKFYQDCTEGAKNVQTGKNNTFPLDSLISKLIFIQDPKNNIAEGQSAHYDSLGLAQAKVMIAISTIQPKEMRLLPIYQDEYFIYALQASHTRHSDGTSGLELAVVAQNEENNFIVPINIESILNLADLEHLVEDNHPANKQPFHINAINSPEAWADTAELYTDLVHTGPEIGQNITQKSTNDTQKFLQRIQTTEKLGTYLQQVLIQAYGWSAQLQTTNKQENQSNLNLH